MPLSFNITDGTVQHMGDGVLLIMQNDETDGSVQNVVLTRDDLVAMLAAAGG